MASTRLPSIFIGHGSPMNALDRGSYHNTLHSISKTYPRPRAIICISAHWMTKGTYISCADNTPIVYDFYGFPPELRQFQYPAPGSKKLAAEIATLFAETIHLDDSNRGLDHGAWSVLTHLYPEADIPVLQLSLDTTKSPEQHFKLGQQLAALRDKGILIVASGNIVHNLQMISWDLKTPPYAWAQEFDLWVKDQLSKRNFKSLAEDFLNTASGRMSVPTTEHYLPLLYTIGASYTEDTISFFLEEIQNASISMRSVIFTA